MTVFAVDIGIHSGFTVGLVVFVFASRMVISVESSAASKTEDTIILLPVVQLRTEVIVHDVC